MKIVIVGAGVVGLSTAWALIRLGHEAVVYDQGMIPNPRADDAPYILPPVDGIGLKFGLGPHLRPGDPDASREPEPEEAAGLFAQLAHFLRDPQNYRIKETRICYYTTASSPRSDDGFLAERQGRCIVISNCSGHMFKFGAVMGERLALAATDALDFSAFARWAGGAPDTAVA